MSAVASLRRILVLLALAAAGGAALAWLRDRNSTPVPANPPEWPPLPNRDDPRIDATIDRPWRTANDDGSCPNGYPVKVKESSGIFHLPGGRFYERTNPDRCYADAAGAEADGYRPSKS